VRRRALLAAAALFAGVPALAQQARVARVGLLYFGTRQSAAETGRYDAFLQGMREAGYVDGRNLVIETRFGDGDPARYPAMVDEMLRAKVDVIVSTTTPMHRVAQKATRTVPIVITVSPDPVSEGLAASLSRPGGNITGLASSNAELSRKYLEVLSDAVPSLSRIQALISKNNQTHATQLRNVEAAAAKVGIRVHPFEVADERDIERAFAESARSRPQALLILADSIFIQHARKLADLARRERLPTMGAIAEYTEAGALMSYGPDIRDNYRRAAKYVDQILKGAKPGELPIEQPSKFELVINLKTAKAIGLKFPKAMLFRADRVIE